MAIALAERERDRRNLDVEIVTGGTDPATPVHAVVVEVLREGIDSSDRQPRKISPADISDADYVVTMGSIDEFRPKNWDGEAGIWNLERSGGGPTATRAQRDEIEQRVVELFDRLEL